MILLFAVKTMHAQAPEPAVDSIQKLLSDVAVSKKAAFYNEISLLYQSKNADSAMKYAQKGLSAAESEQNTVEKALGYCRRGAAYKLKSQYELAIGEYEKALTVYDKIGDSCGRVSAADGLGSIHIERGDGKGGLDLLQPVLNSALQNNCKETLPHILLNIALAHDFLGDFEVALGYYFQSLDAYEKNNDTEGVGAVFLNIGYTYMELEQKENSLKYYKQALEKGRQSGSDLLTAHSLTHIGNHYREEKDLVTARKYYSETLNLFEKAGVSNGITATLINIGITYQDESDYSKARDYFLRVRSMAQKTKDIESEFYSLIRLGDNYYAQKNPGPATAYFLDAAELAKANNLREHTKKTLSRLSKAYASAGDYKKAYQYHLEYKSLSDSLLNAEVLGQINELTAKYESEKKDNEIKLLNKEVEIKTISLARNRYLIIGLAAAVIIIIVFVFLIIVGNRQRIRRKTAELEMKLLRARMDPHFIFNALNAVQNYQLKGDTKEAAMYLAKFAALMRTVLESSFREFIPLEEEIKGLKNYLDLQLLRFCHSFDYSVYIDPSIDPKTVSVPSMLAQPIIENALEHGILNAEDRGKIDISFIMESGKVLFSVSDNGPGPAMPAVKTVTHQSRAIEIIMERLALLENKKVKKIKIFPEKILDKTATIIGSKVIFYIPFKTS